MLLKADILLATRCLRVTRSEKGYSLGVYVGGYVLLTTALVCATCREPGLSSVWGMEPSAKPEPSSKRNVGSTTFEAIKSVGAREPACSHSDHEGAVFDVCQKIKILAVSGSSCCCLSEGQVQFLWGQKLK